MKETHPYSQMEQFDGLGNLSKEELEMEKLTATISIAISLKRIADSLGQIQSFTGWFGSQSIDIKVNR